ncbi:MAG: coproporphyrinogen III oxidase [Akkermansiaceae bacterium]
MSTSTTAQQALGLVTELQSHFVHGLEMIAAELGAPVMFERSSWLRDSGKHGGGSRLSAPQKLDDKVFNRASVNVSQIHYHDEPDKKLSSATALSTIIHPRNPHAPSIHVHISWTEMKSGQGYWRMMADLNPSIPNNDQTAQFQQCLQNTAAQYYAEASKQGDQYFYIPALNRHRGATHFYLEGFKTEDSDADLQLARAVGQAALNKYLLLLKNSITNHPSVSDSDQRQQLAYHTLYFFQVLTLDRGTTSGLLVHNQNDIGIMGSLPSHVSKTLLASWRSKLPKPQEELLDSLLAVLADQDDISAITDEVKPKLAQAVRSHYQRRPEALSLQASGNTLPPTVQNHR